MIKFSFCIGLLFSFVSASAQKIPSEELFLRANKHAENHEYTAALDLYKQIHPKGVAILYNMGMCYKQLKEYSYALGACMSAYKIASFDQKKHIQKEIDALKKELHIHQEPSPFESIKDFFILFFSIFSTYVLQLLFLGLCVIYGWLVVYKKKESRIFHGGLGVMLSILFLGMMLRYSEDAFAKGIIVHSDTMMHAGPDDVYQLISSLKAGDLVFVHETSQEWCKICLQNGQTGWILVEKLYMV